MIRSLLAELVLFVSFFIWPPGMALAGHDQPQSDRQTVSFNIGCHSSEAIYAIIKASHGIDQEFGNTLFNFLKTRWCFRGNYHGLFERVVAVKPWGNGDPMVVFELHDLGGTAVYTWRPKKFWDQQGMKSVGFSV